MSCSHKVTQPQRTKNRKHFQYHRWDKASCKIIASSLIALQKRYPHEMVVA